MTLGELRFLLAKYPDEAEVYCDRMSELDDDLRWFVIDGVYQSDESLLDKPANDVLIEIAIL